MGYVDGFVAAVPAARKDEFIAHAKAAAEVFRDHGAIGGRECWADDVPDGVLTSFPLAVKKGDDEDVVFSWIEWPSKEVRDAGFAALMTDPRMSPENNPMPFDGKRMIFGGFRPVLDVVDGESAKAEVQAVLEKLAAAHDAKSADDIASLYTDDAVIYHLAPPLGERGMQKEGLAAWLSSWDTPITIETKDTEITVSGDLAVSTQLVRFQGTQQGERIDLWFRSTQHFRRTADGWKIAHEHGSVPFHMDGSFRAAVDLTPDSPAWNPATLVREAS